MTDYKDTLNLPKTSFPMKANLPTLEPKILQKWQDLNLYHTLSVDRAQAPSYILHDGPPYANGNLHMGHVLNKTLKDIIVKSKLLSGYRVPFVPGWDCHGLPIELKVEKKIGKAGVEVDHNTFRKKCREYVHSQIELQKQDFERIGVFGDWNNPYLSMDSKVEADTIRALAKIVAKGYIKKGNKPVHWCFDCQSSLAEAEVEYADKTSASIYVKFAVANNHDYGLDQQYNLSAVIWTTTPWSLPANQAVAVHNDFVYSAVQLNDQEVVLLAKELVEQLVNIWGKEKFKILKDYTAKELEGKLLEHPFAARKVPFIISAHVTLDAGTGLVHTAPSHGVDDYNVCTKYNLSLINAVAPNGCYYDEVPHLSKLHIFKATDTIINLLQANNKLLFATELLHSYPHCWRHKSPVIYRATPQWFINLEHLQLREQALAIVGNNNWYPKWGMKRMQSMLEGRPDWCISRQQRTWGVPMAFVIHSKTGELHPDILSIMATAAELVEQGGIEAWFACSLQDLGVDNPEYVKSDDTLDVWFGAGVTHDCILKNNPELSYPADLYLEGSDQHRGWFQSSLLTSVAINGDAPYHGVLTHGYIVDANGKKMSKSLGNVLEPQKLLNTQGADILRLWTASIDYQKDVSISPEILTRIADAYRRIRNTLRYLLSNLDDFDINIHAIEFDNMVKIDQFIVHKTSELQSAILVDFAEYQFHHIYQKLHNFCTKDLGGFYLDIIKDRQYTMPTASAARRSCQTAIYHISQSLVRLIAPILSFTAEEMWGYLANYQESVFLSQWYNELEEMKITNEQVNFWEEIIVIRDEVNRVLEQARNEGIIRSPLEAEVTLFCNQTIWDLLQDIQKELHFIVITSKVQLQLNTELTTKFMAKVSASAYAKCARCWHRCVNVGTNVEHLTICGRCINNISGQDEIRMFV